MANTDQISQSIRALRSETAPDSVTPERVGALLQAITDLINAISNVPEEEIVSVMAAVAQANSNASSALNKANQALSSLQGLQLAEVAFGADGTTVTLRIRQNMHPAGQGIEANIPVLDASHAGILTPEERQAITQEISTVDAHAVANITVQYTSTAANILLKNAAGATLYTKSIGLANTTRAGLMSPSEKTKLANLPSSGVPSLDSAGRVPASQAPQIMLSGSMTGGSQDTLQPGDFYFEISSGHIYYHPSANGEDIDMGVPSKNVVYCHKDTDLLYRWTGTQFTPTKTNPNEGLEYRYVSAHSAATRRYDIPSGLFARLHPSTSIVNINLLQPLSGIPVYRLLLDSGAFYDDGDALIVERIDWPLGLIWQNEPPTIDEIIENYGVIVTIIDNFARFEKW